MTEKQSNKQTKATNLFYIYLLIYLCIDGGGVREPLAGVHPPLLPYKFQRLGGGYLYLLIHFTTPKRFLLKGHLLKYDRKTPSVTGYQRNTLQEVTTSHPLRWLPLSKRQTSIGKAAEKLEPLCSVGGNVKWCNCCGK